MSSIFEGDIFRSVLFSLATMPPVSNCLSGVGPNGCLSDVVFGCDTGGPHGDEDEEGEGCVEGIEERTSLLEVG